MDSISVDLQSLLEIHQHLLTTNGEACTDWCSFTIEVLTLLISIVMAVLAGWAFVYTKREYGLHLAKEQADTLSRYNERYSSDENIAEVVKYLLEKEDVKKKSKDKCDSQKQDDNPPPKVEIKIPSTFQKEMFLRFFEELQYTIEQKTIDEQLAYDMFAHYAIKAFDESKNFVDDLNDDCWKRFRLFAKRMKKIKKVRKKTFSLKYF